MDELKPCPFCGCKMQKFTPPDPVKDGWDREFFEHTNRKCFLGYRNIYPHEYRAWETRANVH